MMHKDSLLLASLHVDVLFKGVEVEQGENLVASVVCPIGGKHLFLDGTGISGR